MRGLGMVCSILLSHPHHLEFYQRCLCIYVCVLRRIKSVVSPCIILSVFYFLLVQVLLQQKLPVGSYAPHILSLTCPMASLYGAFTGLDFLGSAFVIVPPFQKALLRPPQKTGPVHQRYKGQGFLPLEATKPNKVVHVLSQIGQSINEALHSGDHTSSASQNARTL